MPFDSSENGIYIEPQKKIITKAVFQSVFNNTIEHTHTNFQNKKIEYWLYQRVLNLIDD